MSWRCIGCDSQIAWDGKDTFCYTCVCGGHVFYNDQTGRYAPPASLIIAVRQHKPLPHLEYMVGESDYTSPVKEQFIEGMKKLGAVWMKDCPQCQKDGTYQRYLDREKSLAVREAEAIIRTGE